MSPHKSQPPRRRTIEHGKERGKSMASALNLLIAGIIGFIVGLVLELVLEIWYFRRWRKQVRDERVEQLQATVRAKDSRIGDLDGRLERAQTRMNALQGEVAQRTQEVERMQAERLARLAAVVSDAEPLETAELETPAIELARLTRREARHPSGVLGLCARLGLGLLGRCLRQGGGGRDERGRLDR